MLCVFVYALESEIEPGQLMEAFHFSAPTTTTTTTLPQGCGCGLIDIELATEADQS